MITSECAECKKEIGKNASICPYCGFPLEEYSEAEKVPGSQVGVKNIAVNTKHNTIATLMLGVGIFCVLGLLFFVFPAMREQQDESWRKSQNRVGWITGDIELLRLTCDELMDEIMTRSFENSVKTSIRLLSYEDIHLVAQDDDRLECMAQALFTTGSEGRFIFYVNLIDDQHNVGFHRP
jgi:hypothetical protein